MCKLKFLNHAIRANGLCLKIMQISYNYNLYIDHAGKYKYDWPIASVGVCPEPRFDIFSNKVQSQSTYVLMNIYIWTLPMSLVLTVFSVEIPVHGFWKADQATL